MIAACVTTRDESVWAEFIRRFHPLVSTIVLRTTRQWGEPIPSLIDDLSQETYLKLCADDCRLLRNFRSQYPHAIFGFLKLVTANVVHDHFKASRAAKRGAGGILASLQDAGGNDTCVADTCGGSPASTIEQTILLGEIDRCLVEGVAHSELGRSRRIFWLYYRCGLSARAIAALPHIQLTTKGVESTILRLNRLVRKTFTRLPKESTRRNDNSEVRRMGVQRAGSL